MNRSLSDLERAIWLIDQAVSQNFVMIAQVSGVPNDSDLREALDIIQYKHPPLQSRILENEDGRKTEFVSNGVGSIPLQILERRDDDHWLEVAENEIATPLPWREGPLVRVVVLKGKNRCDILITCCHIIADGTSGVTLVRNLLTYVSELALGKSITSSVPLPVRPSPTDFLRNDVKEKVYSLKSIERSGPEPLVLRGDVDVYPEERTTGIIHKTLNAKESKELIAECRRQNTSVHGAISGALLQTLVEQIRKQEGLNKGQAVNIGCCTPVNIRQHFSQPVGEDVGDFIADALHYQMIDDNASLWDVARIVKNSLQEQLDRGEDIKAILSVGDLLESSPSPVELVRTVCEAFPPVIVTNLGRLDIKEKFEDLILEDIHFALSITPVAKSGFGVAVNSFRGRINFNFLFSTPFRSKKRAEELAEGTLNRLQNVII